MTLESTEIPQVLTSLDDPKKVYLRDPSTIFQSLIEWSQDEDKKTSLLELKLKSLTWWL